MLVREAVGAYSPTYHEGPAASVFERAARARGVSVQHQFVDSGRYNLIMEVGARSPAVVLLGHIDTIVGSGPRQARTSIDGGQLYGLGTCDMKGACVTMLLALASVKEEIVASGRGVAVALVVGEEEYGDGAVEFVRELSLEESLPSLIVVGEPSGLSVCLNHYGYFEARLVVEGHRAHSALPEQGVNAIVGILEWIERILDGCAGNSRIACTPRQIRGGTNQFLVPEHAELTVDFHLSPDVRIGEVESILERTRPDRDGLAVVGPSGAVDGDARYGWSRLYAIEGYSVDAGSASLKPLRDAFSSVGRAWSTATFRSHSDAPGLAAQVDTTVVCGPGALEHAHSSDEHIDVDELIASYELYRQILLSAAAGPGG